MNQLDLWHADIDSEIIKDCKFLAWRGKKAFGQSDFKILKSGISWEQLSKSVRYFACWDIVNIGR